MVPKCSGSHLGGASTRGLKGARTQRQREGGEKKISTLCTVWSPAAIFSGRSHAKPQSDYRCASQSDAPGRYRVVGGWGERGNQEVRRSRGT